MKKILLNEIKIFLSKGALVGDCFGRDLEGIWSPNLENLLHEIKNLKSSSSNKNIAIKKVFTDDTALTNAICESLIENKKLDILHMCQSFIQTFEKEPSRGYAMGAINHFKLLSLTNSDGELEQKCFYYAFKMFNNSGSFGNGGAMRCAPIALYSLHRTEQEMIIFSKLITMLTHTHFKAVLGTHLLCFAIRNLLHSTKENFNLEIFLNKILGFIQSAETKFDKEDEEILENLNLFSEEIQKSFLIYYEQKKVFTKKYKPESNVSNAYFEMMLKIRDIYNKCKENTIINLGSFYNKVSFCNVEALYSVPVAVLAFLIASDPMCSNEVNTKLKSNNSFEEFARVERVILYACSFGGYFFN